MEPTVEIIVNGRPAITVAQLAAAKGISLEGARKIISRAALEPAAKLGFAYDQADVELAVVQRPGTGMPGVPKPHKAGTPAVSRKKAAKPKPPTSAPDA